MKKNKYISWIYSEFEHYLRITCVVRGGRSSFSGSKVLEFEDIAHSKNDDPVDTLELG